MAEAGGGGCDAVAVTVGPGGFTGLRAAIALARGFALGWGVPCLGVTLGEAFAASLPHVMAAGARLTSDLGGDPAPFAPPFARLKGLQLPRAARRRD